MPKSWLDEIGGRDNSQNVEMLLSYNKSEALEKNTEPLLKT